MENNINQNKLEKIQSTASSNLMWIIIAVIITALVVGFGVSAWQQMEIKKLTDVQNQEASPIAGKYKKVLNGAAEIPIAWNAGSFSYPDFSKESEALPGTKGDRIFIADNYVAPTDSMEVGGEFGRDSVCIGACDGHAISMSIIPLGASLTTGVATAQSIISPDYKWSKITVSGISADVRDYVSLGDKYSGTREVFIRYQTTTDSVIADIGIIFTFYHGNTAEVERFLTSLDLDKFPVGYY